MTHAWCHDIARDAAVRATEDGRDRPLPTLEEAIAAPFACTSCGGFGMDHRCKESCEECDGEGRVMLPKSGSATSGVEHENKGDGMRTERITLEVTHDLDARLSDWIVEVVDESLGLMESVRVVHEPKLAPRANDDGGSNHAAQAASGGGEGEPVAFGVRMKSGTFKGFLFPSREQANKCAELITDEVVALFDSPPQPRGWLTEEEREIIAGIADDDEYTEEGQNIAKGLLARSSPPEVVLPNVFDHIGLRPVYLKSDVIAAIAAAGGAVKEVGREGD
jgi:hypothetical protein